MYLKLRPATNRDRKAVEDMVFGVLAEYGLKPDPSTTDCDLQDIELSYLTRGGMFDVLVDETGRVVGSVGLFVISPTICELRKMYLAAPARGLGFGRQMLEHALGRARELGFARVVLETASVLREAIALYERYGFRRYTPEHLSARCDAAYFLDLLPTPSIQPKER
ncbi:MAG: GNAT family N-acetyltransferase [Phycisphaerae bacterium]|nr:GNAT family N-acetyltransferase [Phycisphaerae bacterium]